MFIAFLVLAAATVAKASAIDPGSWFSPSNYPTEALKKGIEGSVSFEVDVDPEGKPTACRVRVSSGYQLLDQATCDIVESKGRFIPATGPDGRPVAGHYGNRAIWRMQPVATGGPTATAIDPGSWFTPDSYPMEARKKGLEGAVAFDVDVDSQGKPTACRVAVSSGYQVLDEATCNIVLSKGRFIPAKGPDGKPIAGHYSKRTVWSLTDAVPSQAIAAVAVTGSRLPIPAEDLPFAGTVPRFLSAPVSDSELESYEAAQKFGACLVKANPAMSMAFAMTTPGSDASELALKKLKSRMVECLDPWATQMVINPALVRGVVAEALYRLQFAAQPQPTTANLSVAPIFAASEGDLKHRDEAVIYDFVQCVTAADPSAVRSVALSKLNSSDEQVAMVHLVPAMSPCLYRGQTLQADRLTLRFRLAESLYRWSVAAQLPSRN
jgi:TonB family protein